MPPRYLPEHPTADVWNALALEADNLFSTREWAECWLRHLADDGEVVVVTDDDVRPRVILPLLRTGRLLRQVRLLGNGPADQLGPVAAPGDRRRAAEMIAGLHGSATGPAHDVFLLQDVPHAQAWDELLAGAVEVRRTPSPVVQFSGSSWEEHLQSMSHNFRSQARRRPRQLSKRLAVDIRLASADTLEQDLADLFRLHRLRWGDNAAYAHGSERAFHEDFARAALSRGWLRLWIMEHEGSAVAALHGFRFGQAEYLYQSGRDPRHEQLSLGFVLTVHAMAHAVDEGMTQYRMLRGDESYKSRMAGDDADLRSFAFARTARGRAAVAATTRRRSLPDS